MIIQTTTTMTQQQQIDKEDIISYIDQTYNYTISTYDYGDYDYIRITNGSAGFYADIDIQENTLYISYRRYGYNGNTEYEATFDGLEKALHDCLGL